MERIIGQEERNDFLPKKAGKNFLRYEQRMFNLADRFSPDYSGGMWEFVELHNGAYYTYPDMDGKITVTVDTNGYEGKMSAQAFGIGLSIFIQSWMLEETQSQNDFRLLEKLKAYAYKHEESREIVRMID